MGGSGKCCGLSISAWKTQQCWSWTILYIVEMTFICYPLFLRSSRSMYIRPVGRLDQSYVTKLSLSTLQRRGLRNGNWFRLSLAERALFRCAMWVAKIRGTIENFRLLVMVARIALKLLATLRSRISKAGIARAGELFRTYEENGVFEWAPEMRSWLKDPKAISYLGITELFGR